jgi:hypothetical protein
MHITTIGLDLAKHWFQIHGIDAAGKWSSDEGCAAQKSSNFSEGKGPAWLAWKPARRRIIGRAS